MYTLIMIVHVFVCFVLIAVILLQAGRGGGLSDMAGGGGGQQQSILGTQTNAFMTRATEVCAVVFMVTSISLGIMASSRSKSLIEKTRLSRAVKGAVATATTKAVPSQTPAPAAESAKTVEAAPVAQATPTAAEAVPAAAPEAQSAAAAAPATTNSSAS